MARQYLTIDVGEAGFPFLPPLQGARAFVPHLDQVHRPPRLLWVQNMMPTTAGMATMGFRLYTGETARDSLASYLQARYHKMYRAYTDNGTATYLLVTEAAWLVYDFNTSVWNVVATPDQSLGETSVFFLKGVTYMFHPSIGLYTLDNTLIFVSNVVLTGIDYTQIVAMTAAVSYILAVDADTVYWSSPLNNFNFDPTGVGQNDGAGSSKQLSIRGDITLLVAKPNGAFIYTRTNCTEMTYTNQPANPWVSTEVVNSRGVSDYRYVTTDNNSGVQFAWTDTGVKVINNSQSQEVFPEVAELLSGDVAYDFDQSTDAFIRSNNADYRVAFNFLGGKYLCISYGRQADSYYNYALIYDQSLNRWGKMKFQHLALFEANVPESGTLLTAQDFLDNSLISAEAVFATGITASALLVTQSSGTIANSVGMLTRYGDIVQVDFADYDAPLNVGSDVPDGGSATGYLVYGAAELTHSTASTVTEVRMDLIRYDNSAEVNDTVRVTCVSTIQGTRVTPLPVEFLHYARTGDWLGKSGGKQHQLTVAGRHSVASIIMGLNPQGRR